MGEPFHNYDEVLAFCRLANDPDGFGLGARSIAISTAGWVPGIDRLAAEPLQVKLAISLHAPNDAVRATLMPVNRRYPLEAVMEACKRYREATHRRVFIEYLMLHGVNDAPAQADELAEPAARHRARRLPREPDRLQPDGGRLPGVRPVAGRGVPGDARPPEDRPLAAPVARPRHRRGLRPAGREGRARAPRGAPASTLRNAGSTSRMNSSSVAFLAAWERPLSSHSPTSSMPSSS